MVNNKLSIKKTNIGAYKYSLKWECPNCNNIQKYRYPFVGPKKSPTKKDMFGSIKKCDSCETDYILGNREGFL